MRDHDPDNHSVWDRAYELAEKTPSHTALPGPHDQMIRIRSDTRWRPTQSPNRPTQNLARFRPSLTYFLQ